MVIAGDYGASRVVLSMYFRVDVETSYLGVFCFRCFAGGICFSQLYLSLCLPAL